METIDSFKVDHNRLERGMYISRVDEIGGQEIVTYDIRVKKPNAEPVMPTAVVHTIEHLFATYARNSEIKDNVIYFGPMGCRTGFYFIVANTPIEKVAEIVKEGFKFIVNYEDENAIPGATAWECGNYKDHDLPGARITAIEYMQILEKQKDYNYR